MTDRKLNEIKKEGLEKALLEQATNALWRSRKHLEDASKDGFQNFQKEIEQARKELDDAQQLWRETYKL